MRQRQLPLVLLLAMLVSVSLSFNQAMAKKHDNGKNHHARNHQRADRGWERMQAKLFDGITLSADQKTKVEADFQSFQEARHKWMQDNRAQIQDLHKQMREARKAKDKAKMKDLREQWQKLMASAPKMTDAIAKMRTELTADQQTKFDENVKNMHHRGRKHHKKKNSDG